MPNMYTLVAPCFFGTEHTLSFEVKRLGAQNVKVTDGRVAFEGDAAMIAAANLNLRTAERVLLLLKTFPAATFDELFDGVYSIPWEEGPAWRFCDNRAYASRRRRYPASLPPRFYAGQSGFCTKHWFPAEWWFCGRTAAA